MNTKRNILLAAAVLLLAAACNKQSNNTSGNTNNFFSINENSAQTANWQVYQNSKYSFEYKYPDDFQIDSKLTAAQKEKVSSYLPNCQDNNIACAYYVGGDYDHGNFLGAGFSVARSVAPTYEQCIKGQSLEGAATSEIQINGKTFYYDLTGDAAMMKGQQIKSYRTYFDNACFEVALTVGYSTYNGATFDAAPVFDKLGAILSTFKFTAADNSKIVVVTPKQITEKLYTNSNLGFSFSYPSDKEVVYSRSDAFAIGLVDMVGLQSNTNYDISFNIDSRTLPVIENTYSAAQNGDVSNEIVLGGAQGIIYSPRDPSETNVTVYLPYKGLVYQINLNRDETRTYNDFISTFKFLK